MHADISFPALADILSAGDHRDVDAMKRLAWALQAGSLIPNAGRGHSAPPMTPAEIAITLLAYGGSDQPSAAAFWSGRLAATPIPPMERARRNALIRRGMAGTTLARLIEAAGTVGDLVATLATDPTALASILGAPPEAGVRALAAGRADFRIVQRWTGKVPTGVRLLSVQPGQDATFDRLLWFHDVPFAAPAEEPAGATDRTTTSSIGARTLLAVGAAITGGRGLPLTGTGGVPWPL
jgi:hypothetical protein